MVNQTSDRDGYCHGFRVNGQPIFAHGNQLDSCLFFLSWVNGSKLQHMLESAKNSQMNMIRFWGGGVYEIPSFFDLCDELVLLVWQDFLLQFHSRPMAPSDSYKHASH